MSQKILFINYELPPLGGGGGHANEQIAKDLVAKGHDVTILTSRFSGLPIKESRCGFDIIRIPTWRRSAEKCSVIEMLIFLLSSLIFTPLHFRKIRPQYVISFFSIPCGPAALWLHILFKVPYAIALRGGDVPGFLPEKLATFHKLSNWCTKLIWRYAHKVTANSQGLASLAKVFFPEKEIEVIPNGVDERFFFDRSQIQQGCVKQILPCQRSDVLKVLTVGRLNEQKKIDRLIDSFTRLKSKALSVTPILYIVGDGPKRKRWEAQAKKAGVWNESVFFLGWKQRDDLVGIYQEADVFALASDFEGMPNVLLEAMASSLALVGTKAPGTEDLIQEGQNGYLVRKETLEDFDKNFEMLALNKNLLLDFQKHSYEEALEYTWDRVAQDFSDLSTGSS